ncbi:MAG TPA: ribosome-associated translation inhibitor RaiA [Candidatus Cloacimonadota bacterium]|nr:ribosome-associated translation inhibitor RaiA [Candidatus Cloacimonadota bacterium]
MQITITARHFQLTNAIRDYVYDSVAKLEKYFDNIIVAHFILSFENNQNKVELVLHAPKHNLKSETIETDMYMSIDVAVEKMEQQIKKMKDRWTDYSNKQSLKDSSQFVYANLIEKGDGKKTVKIKRLLAEVMSVDEALDKFDTMEDDYFIFKNVETDRINVLIKKDEDHYKLLQP